MLKEGPTDIATTLFSMFLVALFLKNINSSQKNATYTTTYGDRLPLCIRSTWATDSRSSNKVPQHRRIMLNGSSC